MLDLVCVKEFSSRHMAEQAKSVLEANEIMAMVETDDAGGMRPHLAYTGGTRLMVRAEDETAASEILEAFEPK